MDTTPQMPAFEDRFPLNVIVAPHPSVLPVDELLTRCDFRTQSRSGPGGQHRNRTASGVFVTFRGMGELGEITAEATEQRNQHRNRGVAIERLRYVLAVSLRTSSPLDQNSETNSLEQAIRDRFQKHTLKLAEDNPAKPAVVAMLLNDLHVAGGQPSLVAPEWGVSTSRLVGCLKSCPSAWTLLNRIRDHHGRRGLK